MIHRDRARPARTLPQHVRGGRRKLFRGVQAGCLAALAMLTAGCMQAGYPLASATEANRQLAGGYKLGVGDKLRVMVFDEPSLTGEYEVGADGGVAFPLVAGIPASGQTPDELAKALTAKLAAGGYVLNPRVAVEVLNYRPFYILGEVAKPGEYPYAGQLSLLQAIAKAGGFTPRANTTFIVLRRSGAPSGVRIRVGDPPLLIAPGDTVEVTESFL